MKPYLAYSQRFEQAAQVGERMLREAGEQPAPERIAEVQAEMNNRLAEIIEDQKTVDPPILFTFWVVFGRSFCQRSGWRCSGSPRAIRARIRS